MLSLDVRLGAMSQVQRDAARAWLQACWDSLFAHGSDLADKLCAAGMADCNHDAGELLKALMAEGWIEQGKNPSPTVSQRAFDVNGDGARNPQTYPTRWGYSPVRKSAGLVRCLFEGRRDLPYLLGVYCGEPVCPRCLGMAPGADVPPGAPQPENVAETFCLPCEALYQARTAETAKAEAEALDHAKVRREREASGAVCVCVDCLALPSRPGHLTCARCAAGPAPAPVEKPAKVRKPAKAAKVDPKTCTHAGPFRVITAWSYGAMRGSAVGCEACGWFCQGDPPEWKEYGPPLGFVVPRRMTREAFSNLERAFEMADGGNHHTEIAARGLSLDEAKALAQARNDEERRYSEERMAANVKRREAKAAAEQAQRDAKAKADAEARAKLDAENRAKADECLARMQELRRRRELSEREQRKLAQADKAARKAEALDIVAKA